MVLDVFEPRSKVKQLSNIVKWPSDQIINTNNMIVGRLRDKVNTKIRTNKTGSTSYNDRFFYHRMESNGMYNYIYQLLSK